LAFVDGITTRTGPNLLEAFLFQGLSRPFQTIYSDLLTSPKCLCDQFGKTSKISGLRNFIFFNAVIAQQIQLINVLDWTPSMLVRTEKGTRQDTSYTRSLKRRCIWST
jgi:hypothetical protein